MKKNKFFIVTIMLLLLCITVICGCKDTKDKSQSSPIQIEGMQSGAKVNVTVDSTGQKITTYKNPDNSGGGMVEVN